MFGASPFARSYNPFLHSSYHQPQPQHYSGYSPYYNQRAVDLDRARAIAAQRARRAQWLPDEYDDDDDYGSYNLNPYERAYLNAQRNQTLMERERQRREQEEAEAHKRAAQEQKWQQELDRRQKEDEAVRRKMEQERERRRAQQQQSPQRVPSPVSDAPNRKTPSPEPQQQPSMPQYDEKHIEAASTLQRHFRIRQSIRSIKTLSAEFDALRRSFDYPSTISFQKPSSPPASNDVINIPAISPSTIAHPKPDDDSEEVGNSIPKLAFNATNYHLHAYIEALDKLLVKLDGVESWGDSEVRTRRRSVVKQIEGEQAFIERFWRTSWLRYLDEQGAWAEGDMPTGEEAKL